MPHPLFQGVADLIMKEHNGRGEHLTETIIAAQGTEDDLSILYVDKEVALRAQRIVLANFSCYAHVLEGFAGPFKLFIFPKPEPRDD